jgi:hypothetical protein
MAAQLPQPLELHVMRTDLCANNLEVQYRVYSCCRLVFWAVTLYRLVGRYQRSRVTSCLCLQPRWWRHYVSSKQVFGYKFIRRYNPKPTLINSLPWKPVWFYHILNELQESTENRLSSLHEHTRHTQTWTYYLTKCSFTIKKKCN